MSTTNRLALSASLLLALAACGGADLARQPPSDPTPRTAEDAAKLAAARAHAAEAVEYVNFLTPIDSIEVIDPHAVLVWETPFKAWLVELRPSQSCEHLEDRAALGIDTMHDSLNAQNGYIRGSYGIQCKIDSIREIDVKAWRQTLRESGNA